jgi:hypothetical protein
MSVADPLRQPMTADQLSTTRFTLPEVHAVSLLTLFLLFLIPPPPAQVALTDLSADGAELRKVYTKADGRVRLVLFLSPT